MRTHKLIYLALASVALIILMNGNTFSKSVSSYDKSSIKPVGDWQTISSTDSETTNIHSKLNLPGKNGSWSTTINLLMKVLDNRATNAEARIAAAYALCILSNHKGILIIRDIANFGENPSLKRICREIYHEYITRESLTKT